MDDNGFGLLGMLSVSKVLNKSSAWVAVELSGLLTAEAGSLVSRSISEPRVNLEL